MQTEFLVVVAAAATTVAVLIAPALMLVGAEFRGLVWKRLRESWVEECGGTVDWAIVEP